jgi:transposase
MRLKDQSAQKFRRQMIIRLQEEGHLQSKIAELLDLSQSYVSRILRSFKQQGAQALDVATGKGAVPRLSKGQKEQLCLILDGGAIAYGFEGEIWTSKRVKRVIEEQFAVNYSQRQVDRILKQLNYTRQKPQKVDYRQSKEAVERWKTESVSALKKS